MILPSKQLLSAVLNVECDLDLQMAGVENVLFYFDLSLVGSAKDKDINVYELMHKCKEWARKQNIALDSEMSPDGYDIVVRDLWGEIWRGKRCPAQRRISEYEEVFSAGQWILDNKEQK